MIDWYRTTGDRDSFVDVGPEPDHVGLTTNGGEVLRSYAPEGGRVIDEARASRPPSPVGDRRRYVDALEASTLRRSSMQVGKELSRFLNAERGWVVYQHVPTLAKRAKLSERAVRYALDELESKGWLKRPSVRDRQREGRKIADGKVGRIEITLMIPEQRGQFTFGVHSSSATTLSSSAKTTASSSAKSHGSSELIAAEVEVLRTRELEQQQQQQSAQLAIGDDHLRLAAPPAAAAETLSERLARHGIGSTHRASAAADPDRALAWIALAEAKATENVGGFFVSGFSTGEWPGPRRDDSPAPPALSERERLERKARGLIRNLGADEGSAEARAEIEHADGALTGDERRELLALVDELRDERLAS